MKKHVFLATCLLSVLFSCTTKKEQEEIPVQSLTHELLMGDEYVIDMPSGMALLNDSMIVIINGSKPDKAFHILNHVRKHAIELGNKGQGPDEFLIPFSLSPSGTSYSFFDAGKNRYSAIHLNAENDSWQVEHLFKTDSLEHVFVKPIRNNRYVASGIYEEHQLVVMDKEGTIIKGLGEPPYQDEDEKKVPGMVRSQVYQGQVAVSPSGEKVAHAIMTGDLVYFYDVTTDGDLVLKSKHENAYAQYDRKYGGLMPESSIHHYGICATEDYVYTLYSGRNLKDDGDNAFKSNLIRVYDWDGKLVKKLQLDVDVNAMVVARDNQKIYAIADLPDPVLVVFEMN